jgi:GH15 family glucan-1,4-alpha-glucosidase
VIGNMRSSALVGMNGSIDFLCYPEFDSPTMFAALLEQDQGGRFQIELCLTNARIRQLYLPDTNILLTRFRADEGVVELTEYMPIEQDAAQSNEIIRTVSVIRGNVHFEMRCQPRFKSARQSSERRSAMAAQCFRRPTVPAPRWVCTPPLFCISNAGRNRKLQPAGWNNSSFRIPGFAARRATTRTKVSSSSVFSKQPVLENMDRKIEKRLVEVTLVRCYEVERTHVDGLPDGEGSSTACSFWFVECLARAGQSEKAQLLLEKLLGYANHLGLYSEQLGTNGQHLGNFPQAFTHLALISAATYLGQRGCVWR